MVKTARHKNKKALIILADGFEEIEAVTSIDILRRAGVSVTIAGVNRLLVYGSRKIGVQADILLDKIRPIFDACVLPGGLPGAVNLQASEKVKSILKTMNQQEKIIAALCASPALVLAPLGILNNKAATCFPGMEKHFHPSTRYRKDKVVVDRHIITSQSPGTALAFALTLVENLAGKKMKDKLKTATLAD